MTMTRPLSNTIWAVLMVALLRPAPLLAEPAASARQLLIQAQARAQDHALKNEVKKITERGPFPTELPAPTFFASNLQESGRTSAVSASAAETKIELTSPPMLSASRDDSNTVALASTAEPDLYPHRPAYQVASIAPSELPQGHFNSSATEALLTPATAADDPQAAAPTAAVAAIGTSRDKSAVAPPQRTQPTFIKTTAGKSEILAPEGSMMSATTETHSETGHYDATLRPVVKKPTRSTRNANFSQVMHQRQVRTNVAVEYSDSNRAQLQRIMNRPEVRSLMAQYGLN